MISVTVYFPELFPRIFSPFRAPFSRWLPTFTAFQYAYSTAVRPPIVGRAAETCEHAARRRHHRPAWATCGCEYVPCHSCVTSTDLCAHPLFKPPDGLSIACTRCLAEFGLATNAPTNVKTQVSTGHALHAVTRRADDVRWRVRLCIWFRRTCQDCRWQR